MRLPELLLSDGVLDPAIVEEVQESQAIYGGSFDTNLLELGVIDEQKLQPYLERALGVKNRINVFGDPAASAVNRLPRRQAEAARVVPFRLTGRTLDIVLNDPSDMRAIDEIGFITGHRLQLNVASEARLAHLMYRAYQIPPPSRMSGILQGKVWPKPEISARRSRERQRVSGEFTAMADPMEQDDGEARLMPSVEISAVYDPAAQVTYVPIPEAPLPGPTDHSAPPLTPMVRAFPRFTPALHPEAMPPLAPQVMVPQATRAPTAPSFTQAPEGEPVRRSYEVIAAQLAATEERDQIPPIALGYLSTLLQRVMLFSARRADLHGWDGRGKRLRRETVETLSFPLDRPSVFAAVANTGEPYEGVLPRDVIEEDFVIKLGAETWPEHVIVMPIRVKGRVAALLYCEAVSRIALANAREPITTLASLVAEAFVRLILQRKQTNS